MIKIAFVIDTIESPSAGTEKQLLLLMQYLDRSKFKPYLCVLRNSEWLKNEFHDCELVIIGIDSFKNPKSYLNTVRFASFLKRNEVNIVQTHFVEGNKVGVVAARIAGIKTVLSTRRNQGYWHNPLELTFLKGLNRWVTCFLANSKSTAQWLARTEGVDPQRIEVIHNGLQIEHFFQGSEEQRLEFRKKLDFPPGSIVIGIVANLRPVKAIDIFIRAAKIVLDRSPSTRFVIIGDGQEKEALEKLSTDLGLESFLRFLGKRFDIPEILSCIDIGVLSSCSESFSNSIIEYMAAGLTVVCTDVGGANEVIEEGVNGYIVEVGDSNMMAERLSNIIARNLFRDMGRHCRAKALGMFSHKDIFERYQNFYEELA